MTGKRISVVKLLEDRRISIKPNLKRNMRIVQQLICQVGENTRFRPIFSHGRLCLHRIWLKCLVERRSDAKGACVFSTAPLGCSSVLSLADRGGGGAGDSQPLTVQVLSFSCCSREKSCQIIEFCPKLRGCPPPRPSGKFWIRHRLCYFIRVPWLSGFNPRVP